VTVAALLEGGHEVLVFDSLEHGHRGAVAPGARLVVGDLADGGAIEKALRTHRAEAVVHFAAYSLVGESVAQPARYFLNNVSNGLVLLEAMRRTGVGRIVFSSSAAVYGSPRRIPIAEDDPAEPINPYGESKLFLERVLGRYHRAYGLECVSLRYFNAAGADPDGELGERHHPETHLIPNVLRAAAGDGSILGVFGTDFPTADGTAVRDYIHVTDLASAHVLALRRLLDGGSSEVINLGTNRGYSVREVIAAAEKATGRRVPREDRPRREGDPPILLASKEKAERVLGWRLRFSDLGTILETAWAWHLKESGERKRPGGGEAGR
jgi:UDP-glucose-4-epimerase GalE